MCLKSILGSLELRKNTKTNLQIYLIIKKSQKQYGFQNWARIELIKRLSHNSYFKIVFQLKQGSKIKFKKSTISYNHRKNFMIIISRSN